MRFKITVFKYLVMIEKKKKIFFWRVFKRNIMCHIAFKHIHSRFIYFSFYDTLANYSIGDITSDQRTEMRLIFFSLCKPTFEEIRYDLCPRVSRLVGYMFLWYFFSFFPGIINFVCLVQKILTRERRLSSFHW